MIGELMAIRTPLAEVTATEFSDRRRRAASLAAAEGLDCLLVWARGGTSDTFADVLYFCNHYSPMVWVPPLPDVLTGCEHSAVLITGDGQGTLFVSDFCSAAVQVDEVRRGWDLAAEVGAKLAEVGAEEFRVGVVGEEVLPFSVAEALRRALPRMSLEPADHISSDLRLQLSEVEVALMRRAGEVGSLSTTFFWSMWSRGRRRVPPLVPHGPPRRRSRRACTGTFVCVGVGG